MPKSVAPIVLNETDAITLNSIVSGDLIAGAAVQKRARAIRVYVKISGIYLGGYDFLCHTPTIKMLF